MNEELQQAITTLINKAVSGADATAEFLSGEIPDYIYQLLMWYGVSSFIQMVVGVIAIVSAIVLPPIIYKRGDIACKNAKEKYQKDATATWHWTMIIVSVIFGIVGLTMINIEWLKIWIAPKVWLVDYAAQLVKPIVAN